MKLRRIIILMLLFIIQILSLVNANEDPLIYSESAILMEEKTGKILFEKDAYVRKYPASTTKILTAIIALEKCDLTERQIASEYAINSIPNGYSTANIQVGESFTIEELLNVMLIHSANEAANIIAEHISGNVQEFANLMNEKAKQIGCLDSNFINPNGMHDENHYSTAYDLAMIERYCMQNDKFRQIMLTLECSLPATELWQEPRIFENTNSMLKFDHKYYYPYCNGGKTGFTTPAKNCLISSSNKKGFELISVVLHAEATEEGLSARYSDTINLFEYGYSNFDLESILKEYNQTDYKKGEDAVIGIYKNYKEDTEEKFDSSKNNILKICMGFILVLILVIYRTIKKMYKTKKQKIYYFKIQ